jgi:hypothetical protein
MSAKSPRSQIVKRLQDLIPSLGKVQGVVALEAAFQGNVKAETAYVYRMGCDAGGARPGQEDHSKLKSRQQQIVYDHYAIIIATKNVKDAGGNDSSDINDDITTAISIALLGWIPPGSMFPLEYVRGQLDFQRNMLIWSEIYALPRLLQTTPHHRIVPMNERMFYAIAAQEIRRGMPIVLIVDKIYPATLDNPHVIGFAKTTTAVGNAVPYSTDGALTMDDWTEVTGIEKLVPGAYYYLGSTNYMTNTPPESGILITLGRAVSATTFDIEIEQAIEL